MENKGKVKKMKKNPWKNQRKLTKTNGKQRKSEENEGKLIENIRKTSKHEKQKKELKKNPGPFFIAPDLTWESISIINTPKMKCH